MKKGLIFATTLAMALGVGVAVGAHQSKAAEVKAASTTLYLDISGLSWWDSDGAEVRAHCWGGSAASTTWPGKLMEKVTGATKKYAVEIDDGYTSVVFTRVNPADHTTVWNRSSKDNAPTPITLPTDYSVHNEWILEHDGSSYDDGNYTGSWGLYTPPAATYSVHVMVDGVERSGSPETIGEGELPVAPTAYGKTYSGWFDDAACSEGHEVAGITADTTVYCKSTPLPTVTYTIDDSRVSYSALNLYAFEEGGRHNADWPGVEIGNNKQITVPNDATIIINEGSGEGKKQTVNVTQSGVANDTLRILASQTDGKNDTVWVSAVDEPAEDGYYIVSSKYDNKYAHGVKMTNLPAEADNNAQYIDGYTGAKDETIKVRMFETGRIGGEDVWSFFVANEYSAGLGEADEQGNFVFAKACSIDVYAKWEETEPDVWALHFFVREHVETFTVEVYINGVKGENQQVEDGGLPVAPAAEYGKSFSGWFDDAACSEGHEVTAITAATTVYGKVENIATVTYVVDDSRVEYGETLYLYAFEELIGKTNAPWPGVEIAANKQITVPEDAKLIINNDDDKQTVDVTQSKVANDVLRILASVDGSGHNNAVWVSTVDEPAEDGYYLISSKTSYKYAGATKMTQLDPELSGGNVAILTGYEPDPDEAVKVRSFFSEVDKYSANVDGTEEYGQPDADLNFKFSHTLPEGSKFDIYAFYDGDNFKFSVAPHAEQVTVTLKACKFTGAQDDGLVELGSFDVVKGQPYSVPAHAISGYVQLDAYTDSDLAEAHKYTNGTELDADITLYIEYMKVGYYVISEAGNWSIRNAEAMNTEGIDPNNKAEAYLANVQVGDCYSFVYYDGTMDGQDGLDPDEKGITHTYAVYEDNHVKFTKAGSYAVYFGNNDKIYLNAGLTAFLTNFISEIGGVCNEQGNTNFANLVTAWNKQVAAFNGLDATEKAELEAIGYNGGKEDGTLAERMVAKYHYILEKYGTSPTGLSNFIWGVDVTPSPAYNTQMLFNNTDNTMMIVIIAIAATSALAFGTFFYLKKRKQK